MALLPTWCIPISQVLSCFRDATIGETAYEVGYKTETLVIRASMNPTICVDFMEWDYKAAFKPGELDFLWASPDCKTWSLAAGGHHRVSLTTNGVPNADALRPKTDYAKLCDKMIIRLIEVIEYLKPRAWKSLRTREVTFATSHR